MAVKTHAPQSSAIYWLVNAEPYKAVFNDPSDPDYVGGFGGDDEGITGLDAPELRENAGDITEGHGGWHGNFFAGRRPITMSVAVTTNVASDIDSRAAVLARIERASNLYTQDGALIWFPGDPDIVATTRVNLINDPSFEYDIVGNAPGVIQTGDVTYGMLPGTASAAQKPWTASFDVGGWSSTIFLVAAANPTQGANSLRIKGTKDASATNRSIVANTDFMPVVAGRAYSAKSNLNIVDAPASGSGTKMQIQWYDANFTIISTVDSNIVAAASTGAKTFTITNSVAPTNAAYAVLRILIQSTTTGDVVDTYLDGVQMVAETSAGSYLDGDSTNSSWLGLRGFAQSVNRPDARFVAVRRQAYRQAGIGMNKNVLISLVAADPRIYSTVMYRSTVAHATNATLENQGNWEAPAIFRTYGPYNAGTVTITVTSYTQVRHYTWTRNGFEGGALHAKQIDGYLRLADLDPTTYPPLGTGNVYGNFDLTATDWPGIMAGPSNVVRFDTPGGTTAATIMDIRWRDTWM